MPRDLTGKVILITGASSGIGAATALACADLGMHVSLAARNESKLKDIARQAAARGVRAHFFTCDVDDDTQVRRLFADAWERFGRLDVAFANAGYGLHKSVLGTTDAEHRALFETNYFGTVRTIHAAVPRLDNTPDGLKHLLICSSAASEIALPMYGAYAATKAAQDALGGAPAGRGRRPRPPCDHGAPGGHSHAVFRRSLRPQRQGVRGGHASRIDAGRGPGRPGRGRLPAPSPAPRFGPCPPRGLGLAMTTAMPRVAAWVMRRHARKHASPPESA